MCHPLLAHGSLSFASGYQADEDSVYCLQKELLDECQTVKKGGFSKMGFLDKVRNLFESPPPPPGTVEFPYGCPVCAEGIFNDVNRSSKGWQADNVKTKPVRGVPPFSYSCQICSKSWKVSDPGYDKANNYHWRVTYHDGTGTSYYVKDCPNCNAQLSSYQRQSAGEEGRDHIWCMACGDERYTREVFDNFQASGPFGVSYSPRGPVTMEPFRRPPKEYAEKRAEVETRIFEKRVTELISIGKDIGYTSSEAPEGDRSFDEHGRNIQVLQIGKTLKKIDRTDQAIVRVREELGPNQAEDLKSVWRSL